VKRGKKLPPEKVGEKLYSAVCHFLSFRPRSEKEIHDFLRKKAKKLSSEDENFLQREILKIIENLKKQNLVNDEEFIQWWISQRLEFNPRGERALTFELIRKGIDKRLAEEKVKNIDKAYLRKAALKILAKKIRLYSGLGKWELKKKLVEYLLARGFEYDWAKSVVDDFLQKGYNTSKK
jgi:regulatory protein